MFEELKIKPVHWEIMKVRIVGDTPLIMSTWYEHTIPRWYPEHHNPIKYKERSESYKNK